MDETQPTYDSVSIIFVRVKSIYTYTIIGHTPTHNIPEHLFNRPHKIWF
jgi:hypothetical protein